MALKTNKSFAKRLKLTKKGKMLARHAGHNHYNAKESGEEGLAKHRMTEFHMKPKKQNRYLPYGNED